MLFKKREELKNIGKKGRIGFFIIRLFSHSTYKRLTSILGLKKGNNNNRPLIKILKVFFNNAPLKGIEIGVRTGKNSKYILDELNIKKLYLIDIWDTYDKQDFQYNNIENYNKVKKLFGKDKRIEIIKESSLTAFKYIPDNSIDFIYIDGNHSFNFVYSDIVNFYPKLKSIGFIGGHDVFNNTEVLKAVRIFCLEKGLSFKIRLPDWYIFKNE